MKYDAIGFFQKYSADELGRMKLEAVNGDHSVEERHHRIAALDRALKLQREMDETIGAADRYYFQNQLAQEQRALRSVMS